MGIDLRWLLILLLCIPSIRAQGSDGLEINADGDQVYCPLSQQKIVTDFTISNPSGNPIDALYIQISEGYVFGDDRLELTGFNPGISASWSSGEAKLTITSTSGDPIPDNALVAAVKNVVFENTLSTVSGTRKFSITIGDANYLPETGHYYEFVSQVGIDWHTAKDAAEAREYYGLKGYLATLTSLVEAQFAGKQSQGTGWIGGSDEETEGVWKWMTGPEAETTNNIFWNGGPNGSSPPGAFAFWNNGEPNNLGNEDYAHITAPNVGITGSWNDLPVAGTGGDYEPKGYIVEYGWPGDEPLNIATSTTLRIVEILEVADNHRCGTGQVLLSATPSEGNVLWYIDENGGTPVFSGPDFLTPSLSVTTDYYVAASVNGCATGQRTKVTATVRTIPTIISVNETSICGLGSATLSATASQGVVNWYDQPVGGTLLGTGDQYDTPPISTTTVYYVSATSLDCTTPTRTAVTASVYHTDPPLASSPQVFCSDDQPEVLNLTMTGSNVKWYDSETGGSPLDLGQSLADNTTYWASQTLDGCESLNRTAVLVRIYASPHPAEAASIPALETCDDEADGSGNNGRSISDLTRRQDDILNGQSADDYVLDYYLDASHLNRIDNPDQFLNTVAFEQTIYVKMSHVAEPSCQAGSSFQLKIHSLPDIQPNVTLKNCDEDGVPDGFTDYNLEEANTVIANGDPGLTFSYFHSLAEAQTSSGAIDPFPYNNQNGNTVFVRAENIHGCYRVATVTLDVATTHFPPGYVQELVTCEEDDINDGLHLFDLGLASAEFIAQFPAGQQLAVQYYRSLSDAQLELNEITTPETYFSEVPEHQVLYVRVESLVNGDCFGIGPHLELTVLKRPEISAPDEAVWCANLPPVVLGVDNPDPQLTYTWIDEQGDPAGTGPMLEVDRAGTFTVVGATALGCQSFPEAIVVRESVIATLNTSVVTVVENSANNSISVHNDFGELGNGDYEYALNDQAGPYQDEGYFDGLLPGVHTLYVRDRNGCGLAQLDVPILGMPGFFTPNNDGYNDYWNVRGLGPEHLAQSTVHLYDRFGKQVASFKGSEPGWDGSFNGYELPASDYWYVIDLVNSQTGEHKVLKGHFSLIRR
jgi:gliding motility-associated-like protein